VQDPPEVVEVIRTVVAVTAPLVAVEPKALTQSPTARSVALADWVELTVVELEVVTVSFSVLGVTGFFDFVLLEPFEPWLATLPNDKMSPETLTVDPLTPVTLPDATDNEAN
jgi:hypothetical protein